MFRKHSFIRFIMTRLVIFLLAVFFLGGGGMIVWAISLPLPDFNYFIVQKTQEASTKIYDRTGQVLLYGIGGTVQRTPVVLANISKYAQQATIAIEDADFYSHGGIKLTAMVRALFVDLLSGSAKQGGSTITQQVVKNTVLTRDKSIARKIKEIVLATRMEKVMSKDQILELYLNEISYGGNIYGIEEASQAFYAKPAKDLDLAQAAYLAAIPQAPTHYSPYGNYRQDLENRKNLVLKRMSDLGMISGEEEDKAKAEKVIFERQSNRGIKAPHFVFYIKSYLEEKYGSDQVEKGGLKVTTTLDWDLQKIAQDVITKYGESNLKSFKASNAALVAIDPKTGQILSMVGSRDYFNEEIDGAFNAALGHRQPGSSFKPVVYATALAKGYTPDSVVFDLRTQFNTNCSPTGVPITPGIEASDCYMPSNYDDKFIGPISLRNALAQSRNIPALKVLYLAGIKNSLDTAKKMGITSLSDPNRYGLTLVLGGGEVSLFELTGAYSVFANDGTRNPPVGILKVEDVTGKILEEYAPRSEAAIDPNVAREISDILSDNTARIPAYGVNSPLYFGNRQVAAKTGTTNDYRDAWILGYTPSIAVGAWVGNSDNSPMEKKVAGLIVAPMWNAFMKEALAKLPEEKFIQPNPIDPNLKPVLRGFWQGNDTKAIDNIHSILYWVDKNNPLGPSPANPAADPQFELWETPVRIWAATNDYLYQLQLIMNNNVSQPGPGPQFEIIFPLETDSYSSGSAITVKLKITSVANSLRQADFFLNGALIDSARSQPFSLTFTPNRLEGLKESNILSVALYDSVKNKTERSIHLNIK